MTTDQDLRGAQRKAIQDWNKTYYGDPTNREGTSGKVKAHWSSEEKRAERSELAKANWKDPEYREKCDPGDRLREQWQDPAYRAAHAERVKQRFQDPEFREYWSNHLKERWSNPEFREKVKLAQVEARKRPEVIRALSESQKRRWANPEYSNPSFENIIARIRSGKRTDIESMVENVLIALDLAYEFNYQVGRYFIDFALLNYGIGIECDGYFWHKRKQHRDARRDSWLSTQGWVIVRLTDAEIKQDVLATLNEKVLPLLKGAGPIQLSLDVG